MLSVSKKKEKKSKLKTVKNSKLTYFHQKSPTKKKMKIVKIISNFSEVKL